MPDPIASLAAPDTVRQLLVITHVGSGVIALIVAPLAMITRKGGRAHRRWGAVFYWSMAAIFVTALGLLVFRPNVFLLVIAVLSFYLAFSGRRVLERKLPHIGLGPTRVDWAAAGLALGSGLGFVGWGAAIVTGLYDSGWPTSFGALGIFFGLALARDGWGDIRHFRQPPEGRDWWWFYHMERMSGAYIAAVTAFTVLNVTPLMPAALVWLPWVLPAAVGVPLLSRGMDRYRERLTAARERRPTHRGQPPGAVVPAEAGS